MAWLQQQEDRGQIHLRHFDEPGVSLTPVVPYGLAARRGTPPYPLPAESTPQPAGVNGLFFQTSEQPVNANTVIAAFDAFAEGYHSPEFRHSGKFCFVVLDNAPMHRSKAFTAKMESGLIRGVIPRFIPLLPRTEPD